MKSVCRTVLVLLLTFLFAKIGTAQRYFLAAVAHTSRSYVVTSSKTTDAVGQPLVIVLPDERGIANAFGSEAQWSLLAKSAIIVFPVQMKDGWNCTDKSNDVLFLTKLISDVHNHFNIDRQTIFLMASVEALCLGNRLKNQPGFSHVNISPLPKDFSQQQLLNAVDSSMRNWQGARSSFQYKPGRSYVDSILTQGFNSLDSLRKHSWHKRRTLSFHRGGLYFLANAQTAADYKTFVNVPASHSYNGFQYTSWGNDSMAYFLDFSFLTISQQQAVPLSGGSVLVTVGGGILTSFVAGWKYAFYRHKARPYVAFGAGPMSLIIFGGRFDAGNSSAFASASGSPPSASSLKSTSRTNMVSIIESGLDLRLSKWLYTSCNLRYTHSGTFENAGGINAVRAFSVSVSVGVIMGANKENFPVKK